MDFTENEMDNEFGEENNDEWGLEAVNASITSNEVIILYEEFK
jgi:hypothetical protein